jgi:hypothetical protein
MFSACVSKSYTMIEVIFKIFLTDYIDFQGFITKRIQKPLLIEYIIRSIYVSRENMNNSEEKTKVKK